MDPERLEAIARRFGIELMIEFGSMVSGRVHEASDHDIAVLLARPDLRFEELADLRHELQALDPEREMDLAILNRADPLFLEKVMERCRLLYGSPRRFAELKMYAFRRYQDHRRYLALERRYVEGTLRRLTSR
jgi:predicted nucleotidyltransferase